MVKKRGPLASSYPAAVALVASALVPFLLVTAAMIPLSDVLGHSVGLSTHAMSLVLALSDAAYALGTVIAVQLAVHLPARRMLIVYLTLFVVASLLAAWAPSPDIFAGAFVVQGLCTSLMLVAAVPPLVTGWPAEKMPFTGVIMNVCVFGAVAIGPTIGALQATSGGWRPLFWTVAGIAAVAWALAVLTYEDAGPADPSAPLDVVALVLAGGGCAAAFFGAGELQGSGQADLVSLGPLIGGALMIVLLVAHQYRSSHPLMPVRQVATTLPVAAIVVAMLASSAAFALMELVLTALRPKGDLAHTAVLFIPEFVAAVATAVVFGLLFRTRFTPVLAFAGTVMLAAAGALATGMATNGDDLRTALSAALIGLGVGASVSPALFIAGFSLRSAQVQRVIALIEMLRGVTAFLAAPILVFLATDIARSRTGGIRDMMGVCAGLAAGGGLLGAAVFVCGGGRLQVPDIRRWNDDGEPAWESPALFARLRRRESLPAPAREP